MNKTSVVAAISMLCILIFMLAWFLYGAGILSFSLFGVAVGAMGILLVQAYALASRVESQVRCVFGSCMRVYILLHLVPASFLIAQFFKKTELLWCVLYLVPFMLFFWTGRRSWGAMYDTFGSNMYQFFYRGNTGMLVSCPLLLGLGVLFQGMPGTGIYIRVLVLYFTVHFLLTGIAVVKLDKDISG